MPQLRLFYRLVVRPLRREPLRTCLTALAVALGVGVVLAIELAGDAAAGSFRSSVETLAGDADFEVTATAGVPPVALAKLAALPYALKLQPRIEGYAVLDRRTVPLIGVDTVGNAPEGTGETEDLPRGDWVWLGRELGHKPGDRVRLLINDRVAEYGVRGVLGERSGEVVVMDLALATRALGRSGQLDRILVHTPRGKSQEEWERVIANSLPPGVTVAPHGTRTRENRRMLDAFRWNLRVLSYIALIVGAFLIYNTISVSVVRRRVEIGVVRALGATKGSVLAAFLGEAACFGAVGGALGIALGRLLAAGAVGMVSATVDSLYVSSRPAPVAITWELSMIGFALGVGMAVLSALAPAWEAAQVTPVEAMARGQREHDVRLHKTRDHLLLPGFLELHR